MNDKSDGALDALTISKMGQAFDVELKQQTAGLEQALADRDGAILGIEHRLEVLFDATQAKSAELVGEIARLRANRDQASSEVARQQQQIADLVADARRITGERDLAKSALDTETMRLKLVHQGQVEALFARHREFEITLRDQISVTEAQLRAAEDAVAVKEQALAEALSTIARLEERAAHFSASASKLEEQLAERLREGARLEERVAHFATIANKLEGQLAERLRESARLEAQLRTEWAAQAALAAEDSANRIAILTRNARAREAMLAETLADAHLQGKLEAARETARADHLATRGNTFAEVIRVALKSAKTSALDPLRLLLDVGTAAPAAPQSVANAVDWLRLNAEVPMTRMADAAFEAAAAILWTDATFVAAAYQWLLGRPVDEQGLAHYCLMLRSRMTRRDVLIDLARSAEAVARLTEGAAVRGAEDRNFIMAGYDALLDRGADTGGLAHYLAKLDSGISRGQVLMDLARSAEALAASTATGTALRATWHANQRLRRTRLAAESLFLRRLPSWQQAWRAGRIAVLACDAAQTQRAMDEKFGAIDRAVDQRVAAARVAATGSMPAGAAAAGVVPSMPTEASVVQSLPAKSLDGQLGDSSRGRTPSKIVGYIRNEIKDLGL